MGYRKNNYFILIIFLLGIQLLCFKSFAQPVFYLNANGTNGSNTFTDSGPNNYPITVNGNPVNGSNCNNTAAYIDGTTWTPSGHYLFSPANPDFNMGSSDFTIHFWVYLENITSTHAAFDLRSLSNALSERISFIHYPGTGWNFSDRQVQSNIVVQGTATMLPQTWTHVALVRSGNNFSIYINGCRVATANWNISISVSSGISIGYSWDNRDQLNGYIDEFYVYKGTALWTDTFVPPGCSVFSSCITCNTPISSSVTSVNIKCKGDSTGSITVAASGGTAPYTYQWSGYASSQTGATASGLPAGTYSVIVSDQSCYADTHTVVITEPAAALLAEVSPADTILCLEENTTLTALVSGGTPPYSYLWSNGNSNSSQQVSPLVSTNYTLTVADSNNCSADTTATISVNIPSSQFTAANACLNDSAHFINSSSVNMGSIVSYTWNFGDGSSASTHSPAHLYTTPGTYTVQLKIISDNGCPDSMQMGVTLYPMPTALFHIDNVCDQEVVVFTDSSIILPTDSIVSWSWDMGDGSPAYTSQHVVGGHLYSLPGIYSAQLIVSSSNGCVDSITKPVTVYPNPVANFNNTTVCSGVMTSHTDSSYVTGSSINSWQWDFGDNTPTNSSQNPAHLYTGCGNFSTQLLVITADGCRDSVTQTVFVHCLPSTNAGTDDTLCFSENTVLSVSPNGPGYSYSWSTLSNPNFASVYNPAVNPPVTTAYTVILTDTNSCFSTDSITIFVDPEIVLAASVTNVTCNAACNGQIAINASGGTMPYLYNWSGTCTTATCTGLCPGTYSLTLIDAWGCESNMDTSITEPIPLLAFINTFSPATCNDTCNGAATIIATGGTPGYTFSWNTVPAQTTAAADSLCAGTYICIVTDANLCQSADTVTIAAPPEISLVVSATPTDCGDSTGTATVNAFGGTPGYSYSWSASGQTGQTATNLNAATHSVVVTDANGCSALQNIIVNTVSGPFVIASADNSVITNGNSTNLTVTGQGTYLWTPSDGLNCNTCQSTIAQPSETTSYCVVVTDTNHCADSSCITITVEYSCLLTVPNAFSPNNDGHNDVLTLHGWDKCVTDFSILIFNRWGEKVFESKDPQKTWDGSDKAEISPKETLPNNSGVFIYYISAKLVSGEEITRKGNITVIN
jgi:gliding motility-associated-like protein